MSRQESMIRRRRGPTSAIAVTTAVAAMLLLFCVGLTDGYAFSTKGATNNGAGGGTASSSGGPPSFAAPTVETGTSVTSSTTSTTTTSSSNPLNDNTAAPIFSGFGHVTDTPGLTNPTTTGPPPTFAGFGNAHGVSPVFPTTPQASSSTTTTTTAAPPPPVFSGFGHALGRATANGVGGIGGATTTIPWGVVGTSLHDANNNMDDEDDDDDTTTSVMDPDLYEASQFLHEARDKVMQLRQELEQKANQQKELVQQLRSELK